MSEAQKQAVLWLVIIGLACYLFNINPVSTAHSVGHSVQEIHNQNAHP